MEVCQVEYGSIRASILIIAHLSTTISQVRLKQLQLRRKEMFLRQRLMDAQC